MSPEVQDGLFFAIGIFLSAFFSGSEAALISVPSKRVKQLMEDFPKNEKLYKFLLENSSELLTTILIGNNFVNIFVAALATTIAQSFFDNEALSYSVGITTILILIFGEIIPKTFMRNHAERLLIPITWILRICYYLLYPAVQIFMLIIRTVLGENASLQEKIVTKDDIEFMVNEAEKEKSIDSKQLDLLNSILEFPTIKVKDIMTPRTNVHAIKRDFTYDQIIELIREVHHSRYPIFDDDLDDVVGFIHVKDVIFQADKNDFSLENFMNDPFFVYEHMKLQAVFDHMNRNKVHMALVKDENGLVVGIVTLEDIMEEIFGEIQDEHDTEEDLVKSDMEQTLEEGVSVDGSISLRDLDNEYDLHIPLNDNYSTLRGFILDMLGNNFPSQGNVLFWGDYSFELLEVVDKEIETVKIVKSVVNKDDDSDESVNTEESESTDHIAKRVKNAINPVG